jgi:hypothetical protein
VEQKASFVVPASRTGLLKAVAIGGSFCAVMIFTFANMPSLPDVVRYGAEAVVVVVFVLFAGMGSYVAYRLLANVPVLVVDAEGLIDRSSLGAVGRIRWNEIADIRTTTYFGQAMVSIVPVDFDHVISRQRSPIRRASLRFNKRRGLGIAIAVSILSVSVAELCREIEERRPRRLP